MIRDENELWRTVSLNGDWQFSLNGAPPVTLGVPGTWDAHAQIEDLSSDGPGRYSRSVEVESDWLGAGNAVLLEIEGAALYAEVRVNEQHCGSHLGQWAAWQLDITPALRRGTNTIEILIWKAGARFPPRENLAGFLPDVFAPFGGLWRPVSLRICSPVRIANLQVLALRPNRLILTGTVSPTTVSGLRTLAHDRNGMLVQQREHVCSDPEFHLELALAEPEAWGSRDRDNPLYTITLEALDAEGQVLARATRRVGFREIQTRGQEILLNGQGQHLRGALTWGWNPQTLSPDLARPDSIHLIQQVRQFGFNLFKACLYVPSDAFLDVADEFGMMVWLELPLWQPSMTESLRGLVFAEYEAILRRIAHHPCIGVLSLGCELDAQVDAGMLKQLRDMARHWCPNVLLCGNSGSADAYGGADSGTFADDFYDYHFYCEPTELDGLLDHFDRAYRPVKPWLFGECLDADTWRRPLDLAHPPRWFSQAAAVDNPHWELKATAAYSSLLAEAGVVDDGAALNEIGRRQSLHLRKHTLETVRARHASGGYVLTGWQDTPISTSGVVDDDGEPKFTPAEYEAFNTSRVLCLCRPPRRTWTHGGDRATPLDPYVWMLGQPIAIDLVLSNGGLALASGQADWTLTDEAGRIVDSGRIDCPSQRLAGGAVSLLAELRLNLETRPGPARLSVDLLATDIAGVRVRITNSWRVALVRHTVAPPLPTLIGAELLSRSTWPAWLKPPLESQPKWLVQLPFWREAIHEITCEPAQAMVCTAGAVDMRALALTTDCAIDPSRLRDWLDQTGLGDIEISPLWRRFDARALTWSAYAVRLSRESSLCLLSTLALHRSCLGPQLLQSMLA